MFIFPEHLISHPYRYVSDSLRCSDAHALVTVFVSYQLGPLCNYVHRFLVVECEFNEIGNIQVI